MSTSCPAVFGDAFPDAVDVALAWAADDDGFDPALEASVVARLAAGPGLEDADETPDPLLEEPEATDQLLDGLWREVDAEHLAADGVPTSEWTDAQVVEALAAAERQVRAATARGLRLAAELARRRPARSTDPDDEGLSRYALDEIAVAIGLPRGAARARLCEARTAARRLPGLLDAMQAGLLTLAGLRKVSDLTVDLSDAAARSVSRDLLARLGQPWVPALQRMSLQGMYALDPAVTRSVAARATTRWLAYRVREHLKYAQADRLARQERLAGRRVVLVDASEPGGMSWLGVYAPRELLEAAYARIDALAHTLTGSDGSADARSMDQKRADVHLDLLLGPILGRPDHHPGQPTPVDQASETSAQPPAGGWGAVAVNLNVLLDHTRCTARNRGGCVGDAGRLGPVTAESLTDLIALAEHTGGTVTGAHAVPQPCPGDADHQANGPGAYEPSEPLRRQVRARWRHCAFPGCHRPARDCDLDHSIPHSRGGPTCTCNLTPICEHHHQLKHDHPDAWPPWQLTNHGDHLTWTTPTGLVIQVTPDPHDPDPPPAPRPVEQKPPF